MTENTAITNRSWVGHAGCSAMPSEFAGVWTLAVPTEETQRTMSSQWCIRSSAGVLSSAAGLNGINSRTSLANPSRKSTPAIWCLRSVSKLSKSATHSHRVSQAGVRSWAGSSAGCETANSVRPDSRIRLVRKAGGISRCQFTSGGAPRSANSKANVGSLA